MITSGVANTSIPQYHFKVVLLGEGSVGKTSILSQYFDRAFEANTQSTLQAAFRIKHCMVDDSNVKISLWDTAGQERFHALGPIYYRGSDGAVVVYDLTDKDSFGRARLWIEELRRMLGDSVCISIVGNKVDLAKKRREVLREEAEALALQVNAQVFETSAFTKEGIQEMFDEIARRMLERCKLAQQHMQQARSVSLRPQLVIAGDKLEVNSSRRTCC